jgi:hypothetical protein
MKSWFYIVLLILSFSWSVTNTQAKGNSGEANLNAYPGQDSLKIWSENMLIRKSNHIDWFNLQWPPQANITAGGSAAIYVRCYESGVTEVPGADARILVWIGYNSSNTNPNTWTNWIPASYNNQFDNVDEYAASLGNTLPSGIYYFASRIQYDGGSYLFGGYNAGGGGLWDGLNNISGILSVGKQLARITLSNTLQLYDGNEKQVTASTNPAGLDVDILYNGSASLPIDEGTYSVTANVNSVNYQGSQTGGLTIYSVPQDPFSTTLRNKFIWVMYDQVHNQAELTLALSCEPDVINRGWFKWGPLGGFSWDQWSWMTNQANQEGAIFGGGGTVMALYPGEVDNEKFLRMVDRTPLNEPMHFAGDNTLDYFNGDLQKQEYLDFLLGWMYDQIDAGANTLHLDGIADVPSFGFSDNSMSEFNNYLINKYVAQQGWTVNDSRWQTIFDISLGSDCTNGTINTFDYRKFLVRNGFENNPLQYPTLLAKEFGTPLDYIGTYADVRNKESCRYLYESIKEYAGSKELDVSVTTNGFSKYVDYQTTGVWSNWSVSGGNLDISPSYIQQWREIKNYSMINMHRDIPLIVFHDWGFGMPFYDEISADDQILWLRVYAPEVFAAGAVFAWPFAGGGSAYLPSEAVMDTMQNLIQWYSSNRDLYIGSTWVSDNPVNLMGQSEIAQTLLDQYGAQQDTIKRIAHLINKRLAGDRSLVKRENFTIQVPSSISPKSVWAVSPDFNDYQKLNFILEGENIEVTVSSLSAYTLVVLDYKNKVPQKIHFDSIPEQNLGNPDFELQAYASSGLPVTYSSSDESIATIVDGKVHMVASGHCILTASQQGDVSFEAAQDVQQNLSVNSITVLKEMSIDGISIWPNPCHGLINVHSISEEPYPVILTDMLGSSMFERMVSDGEIDVSALPPGIYILKVRDSSYRLIKL